MKIKRLLLVVGLIAGSVVGIGLAVVIIGSYLFNWNWNWTGISPYISPPYPKNSDFQRGKTLWDWLQLLVVPLALAIIAFFFNRTSARTERQIAVQRYEQDRQIVTQRYEQDRQIAMEKQREDLLQTYLDRMSKLLLENQLLTSPTDEVRMVARVPTIAILFLLDARRIGNVFAFLCESGLMSTDDAL